MCDIKNHALVLEAHLAKIRELDSQESQMEFFIKFKNGRGLKTLEWFEIQQRKEWQEQDARRLEEKELEEQRKMTSSKPISKSNDESSETSNKC